MQAENITLYFKDGSSDKEYRAQLVQDGDGYQVHFQYGKRNGTLTAGSKTTEPVPYAAAKKAYDKLVSSKTSKGYTPGAAGVAFENTSLEERVTGVVPQLLNPITEEEVDDYINDPAWVAQQKHNGHRRLVRRYGAERIGINRKGLAVGLPETVVDALAVLHGLGNLIVDGELMGSVYAIFDVLEVGGQDQRGQSYDVRLGHLDNIQKLLTKAGIVDVFVTPTAYTAEDKRELYEEMRRLKREGVVFTRRSASYVAGRPNSKGNRLKRVFRHSATVIVTKPHATKRSVSVHAFGDDGQIVKLGNVTVPANYAIPKAGALVEVVYMHMFPGGSLYQPQYQGERDDLAPEACTTAQLHYFVPEVGDEEDAAEMQKAAEAEEVA
jgi:bifunctional non-homologous end joining protein LigD